MPHAESFSICTGGPVHKALEKAGLASNAFGYGLMLAIGWLPVLILTATGGTALGGVKHPFLLDLGPWIRYFLGVPIAVFAEGFVDRALGVVVDCFRRAGLVQKSDLPAFEVAVERVQRSATSDRAELVLLAIALALPHLVLGSVAQLAPTDSWYGSVADGGLHASWAGRWYAWVSLPLVEFLVLRWLWRMAAWWGFLWRASRFTLALVPAHPDGAAGLGFLSLSPRAFLPILVSVSVLGAAGIAKQIQFGGASLAEARVPIIALLVCQCVLLLAPHFFFLRALTRARGVALIRYGLAGTGMGREFDSHWIGAETQKGDSLLRSSESSTMIDFAGTYGLVRAMQPLGISIRQLLGLVVPLAAPFAPLLLFEYSVADILKQVLQMVR